MRLFDKIKEFFNRISGKEKQLYFPIQENVEVKEDTKDINYVEIDLPEDEIVSAIQDNVLHADSKNAEEILKHNLEIILKHTKQAGRLEKFALIREDDVFPEDWKWDVLSKNTNLEKQTTTLSYELRKAYALREAGLDGTTELFGNKIPIASTEQTNEALAKVDKNIGSFLLPPKFRSTKHFTINTPLEVTGNYNMVETERDYIVIDNIDNFIKSGYGYSVAYQDAYLDVTHESLPISEEAVVLIKEENYDRITSDSKIAQELAQRKVVKYTGDTHLAVNMVLSEMGVLPSTIGTKYANYDLKARSIIDNSIRNLAKENDLEFNRSHAGSSNNGHFTNYYDEKNKDYEKAYKESIDFLIKKFPEQESLFEMYLTFNKCADEIVEQVGVDKLLTAIDEYNEIAKNRLNESKEKHKKDRMNITPQLHEQFTNTISLINEFYNEIPFELEFGRKAEIESNIQKFFQCNNIEEQQKASNQITETLYPKVLELQNQRKKVKQEKNIEDNLIDNII